MGRDERGMTQTTSERFCPTMDIALLRAVCMCRPIGEHRHFHMLSILHALDAADKRVPLTPEDVWNKLHEYYNLEGLNEMVCTLDTGADAGRVE